MSGELDNTELFRSGHTACAGCAVATGFRHIMKALGKDTIIVNATGCSEIFTSAYPKSAWAVPYIHCVFENAAPVAAGVVESLRAQGNDHTTVAVIAGDGATYDIGFGHLSGMLERGHDVLYICYDNEAYMNCLSGSSLVITAKGVKKVSEIRRGEMVYAFDLGTHKLVLRKCSGVFDNGMKRTFKVTTLHHEIDATGNHPFLVVKRNGKGKKGELVWKKVDELVRGDQIVVSKNLDGGSSRNFNFSPSKLGDYKVNKMNKIKIPEKSSPALMKYLGIYLGDGWTREKKAEVGFALPGGKKGRKELLKLHKSLFGSKVNEDSLYVYVPSVNLARFINSLGFGKGAKNKTIPDWIFTLPKREREAFIEGLMLADGYKYGKSWRYVSASEDLLTRMKLLLQTLGYRVGKIHWQVRKKGTLCVYRQLLKDTEFGAICFSKRIVWNVKKYKTQYKYQNFLVGNKWFEVEEVKSVTKGKVEQTWDLRVDGEHNFIANGIVVHNTGIQRSGATPWKAKTTTSQVGSKYHGKMQNKKPLTEIVAAHNIPYVATSTSAHYADLQQKVTKAKGIRGPRFLNVLCTCVPGWGTDPSLSIQYLKDAVDTHVWPLMEIEEGFMKLNLKPEKKPVETYLKGQKRFKHLTPEETGEIQKMVDERWEHWVWREKVDSERKAELGKK